MASRRKLNKVQELPALTPEEEAYIASAGTGALLNPRFDSTFKAIFTQNTPESKTALRSFLEAATERKITKVNLLPSEAPADYPDERGLRYDRCPNWLAKRPTFLPIQRWKIGASF